MKTKSGTFTAEFAPEWERERLERLRKRFKWYVWVVIGLNLLGLVAGLSVMVFAEVLATAQAAEAPLGGSPGRIDAAELRTVFHAQGWPVVLASMLTLCVFGFGLRYVTKHRPDRRRVISLVTWMILAGGVIGFSSQGVSLLLTARMSPTLFLSSVEASSGFITLGLNGAVSVMLTHVLASLFLPWTARESVRPIWPLLYMNAVFVAVVGWERPALLVFTLVASPILTAPGTVVAWWKHSRFRNSVHNRALRKRYGDMKRELVDARRLHEDLFPASFEEPALVMRYAYEPMRQIGGDYLYARSHHGADGELASTHVVVLDVTGHGVSAALTVNRIHGEIDRQLAIDPALGPAALLSALNEYLHLTVAARSMYATALCVRVDVGGGAVEWSSAGHPPAFMRTVDGRLLHLHPTTIVLGAVPPESFERVEERLDFGPGDTIVAYTDGATETRVRGGRMVRVQGLEGIVGGLPFPREAPQSLDAAREVAARLDELREGAAEDDTLVVQLTRPLIVGGDAPASRKRRGRVGVD